jgi:EGF-like domain
VLGKVHSARTSLPITRYLRRCDSIPLTCSNTTCSNNGVCYIDGSSGVNTVRCLCFQDYTGQYCQSALVSNWSCLSNPCGANGTCIPQSSSSYTCRCPNGLTGQSCNSSNSPSIEKSIQNRCTIIFSSFGTVLGFALPLPLHLSTSIQRELEWLSVPLS